MHVLFSTDNTLNISASDLDTMNLAANFLMKQRKLSSFEAARIVSKNLAQENNTIDSLTRESISIKQL